MGLNVLCLIIYGRETDIIYSIVCNYFPKKKNVFVTGFAAHFFIIRVISSRSVELNPPLYFNTDRSKAVLALGYLLLRVLAVDV